MGSTEIVIEPRRGWQSINVREVWPYRELFLFLIWRDIKIRYRQTILGSLWAVLQPLLAMATFTLVFNHAAGVQSDGAPYTLFSFAGLIPWTFFANAVSTSGNSLISYQHMVSKVYFPRLFIPLSSVAALGLDMLLSLGLMGALMAYYRRSPAFSLVFLPVSIACAFLTASGVGLALSAFNVKYRDVKYVIPFLVQMGLFLTPVIYPWSYLPIKLRRFLAVNPLSGICEGFRYSLLGTPGNWHLIALSILMSIGIFLAGMFIFSRMERQFADVI